MPTVLYIPAEGCLSEMEIATPEDLFHPLNEPKAEVWFNLTFDATEPEVTLKDTALRRGWICLLCMDPRPHDPQNAHITSKTGDHVLITGYTVRGSDGIDYEHMIDYRDVFPDFCEYSDIDYHLPSTFLRLVDIEFGLMQTLQAGLPRMIKDPPRFLELFLEKRGQLLKRVVTAREAVKAYPFCVDRITRHWAETIATTKDRSASPPSPAIWRLPPLAESEWSLPRGDLQVASQEETE